MYFFNINLLYINYTKTLELKKNTVQNLVNKIWFRNDDNYTISEVVKQLGKINVTKENFQTNSSRNYDKAKEMFGQSLIREVK